MIATEEVDSRMSWFVDQMRERLRAEPRDWRRTSVTQLLSRVRDECVEIFETVAEHDQEEALTGEVVVKCADLANRAMMLADFVRSR